MLVDAVRFLPDMNMDDPIQLTLFASAETVTVIVEPGAALDTELGEMVTTPVTPELDSICRTSAWTLAVVAAGNEACRAPSRDAVTSNCFTMVIRPMSIRPIVNRIMRGATMANSTSAAPTRRLDPEDRRCGVDRTRLVSVRLVCFAFGFMLPDRIESFETISQEQQVNKWSRSKRGLSHQPLHSEQ